MGQEETYFHDHWIAPEVCELPSYLASGSILALGAGYAGLWLASQGFKVTAAGESSHLRKQAKELNLSMTFVSGRTNVFDPALDSSYDAVVVLGKLHRLPLNDAGTLVAQLKQHTNPNGYHVIRTLGDPPPRTSDTTKTSLVPWLEWYSDWRIVEFCYRDHDVSSRYAESPHWLFDHTTTIVAQKVLPAQRQQQLGKLSSIERRG